VPDPPIDGRRIIALVQSGARYRMTGPDRVRIDVAIADLRPRAAEVRKFMKMLASP
jgi:transcription-repair coupling factor (superfamily II helicase)